MRAFIFLALLATSAQAARTASVRSPEQVAARKQARATYDRLRRAHQALVPRATTFDQAYVERALAGVEGTDWVTSGGFFSSKYAIPPRVMSTDTPGRLELGGHPRIYNDSHEISITRVPGAGYLLRTPRVGFDPGAEFLVTPSRVLRTEADVERSMPTVGAHGGLAWSTPRSWLSSERRRPLRDADAPTLKKMVDQVVGFAKP